MAGLTMTSSARPKPNGCLHQSPQPGRRRVEGTGGKAGFSYLSGRLGQMPGTKSSSPRDARTITPWPRPAPARRRRNAYVAAAGGGVIAVAIVALLLASLLGGKGNAKPAVAHC